MICPTSYVHKICIRLVCCCCAEYKLARSSGTITARLPKSLDPDFPCDLPAPLGLGLLPLLRVDQLPVLDKALREWGMWMTEMFSHGENADKVGGSTDTMIAAQCLWLSPAFEGSTCRHQCQPLMLLVTCFLHSMPSTAYTTAFEHCLFNTSDV